MTVAPVRAPSRLITPTELASKRPANVTQRATAAALVTDRLPDGRMPAVHGGPSFGAVVLMFLFAFAGAGLLGAIAFFAAG